MSVKPTLVTLWLADEVSHDEQTARPTLHGLFNQIPLSPGATEYATPFTVFFSVTDVRSRTACDLSLVNLATLEVVYQRPVILDRVGPSEVVDMTVRVNRLPIPHPGDYAWDLFHENELRGSTRMRVTESD